MVPGSHTLFPLLLGCPPLEQNPVLTWPSLPLLPLQLLLGHTEDIPDTQLCAADPQDPDTLPWMPPPLIKASCTTQARPKPLCTTSAPTELLRTGTSRVRVDLLVWVHTHMLGCMPACLLTERTAKTPGGEESATPAHAGPPADGAGTAVQRWRRIHGSQGGTRGCDGAAPCRVSGPVW